MGQTLWQAAVEATAFALCESDNSTQNLHALSSLSHTHTRQRLDVDASSCLSVELHTTVTVSYHWTGCVWGALTSFRRVWPLIKQQDMCWLVCPESGPLATSLSRDETMYDDIHDFAALTLTSPFLCPTCSFSTTACPLKSLKLARISTA